MFEDGAPVKCNPLAFWEFRDCFNYTDVNGLDIHPLHAEVGRRSHEPARAPRHSGAAALGSAAGLCGRMHGGKLSSVQRRRGEADAAPLGPGPGRPRRRWLAAVRDAGSCTVVL